MGYKGAGGTRKKSNRFPWQAKCNARNMFPCRWPTAWQEKHGRGSATSGDPSGMASRSGQRPLSKLSPQSSLQHCPARCWSQSLMGSFAFRNSLIWMTQLAHQQRMLDLAAAFSCISLRGGRAPPPTPPGLKVPIPGRPSGLRVTWELQHLKWTALTLNPASGHRATIIHWSSNN